MPTQIRLTWFLVLGLSISLSAAVDAQGRGRRKSTVVRTPAVKIDARRYSVDRGPILKTPVDVSRAPRLGAAAPGRERAKSTGTRAESAALAHVRERPPTLHGRNESPGRLGHHEQLGGHTLERHVGQGDLELAARLSAQQRLKNVSGFKDRPTASKVVSDVVKRNHDSIREWSGSAKPGATKQLEYRGNEVVGQGLKRGDAVSVGKTDATVVLKALEGGEYRVLTAYPK